MKIAVIFSGQPRTASSSFENLKANVFTDEHEFTYFGHIWKQSDDDGDFRGWKTPFNYEELDNSLKLYSFEKIEIEKQKMFKNFWEGKVGEFANGYPMNYSIQRACLLFKDYIEKSQNSFDFVLKIRLDHLLTQKINFENLDLDKVHVSAESWSGSRIVDDTLCGTSQKNFIKIYSTIFDDYFEKYKNSESIPNTETSFTERLIDIELYKDVIRNPMFNFRLNRYKA